MEYFSGELEWLFSTPSCPLTSLFNRWNNCIYSKNEEEGRHMTPPRLTPIVITEKSSCRTKSMLSTLAMWGSIHMNLLLLPALVERLGHCCLCPSPLMASWSTPVFRCLMIWCHIVTEEAKDWICILATFHSECCQNTCLDFC